MKLFSPLFLLILGAGNCDALEFEPYPKPKVPGVINGSPQDSKLQALRALINGIQGLAKEEEFGADIVCNASACPDPTEVTNPFNDELETDGTLGADSGASGSGSLNVYLGESGVVFREFDMYFSMSNWVAENAVEDPEDPTADPIGYALFGAPESTMENPVATTVNFSGLKQFDTTVEEGYPSDINTQGLYSTVLTTADDVQLTPVKVTLFTSDGEQFAEHVVQFQDFLGIDSSIFQSNGDFSELTIAREIILSGLVDIDGQTFNVRDLRVYKQTIATP